MVQRKQHRQKAKIELENFVEIEKETTKEELVQSVPSPSTPPAAASRLSRIKQRIVDSLKKKIL